MITLSSPKTHSTQWRRGLFWLTLLLCLVALPTLPTHAQATPTPIPDETPSDVPDRVEVEPLARDEQIRERLQNILEATGWFVNPAVEVNNGVVFLTGEAKTEEFKRWAGDLARNTQDVAAVVNQITIREPAVWDFEPALAGLQEQGRRFVRAIPLMGFSLLVLIIAIVIARLAISLSRRLLYQRFKHSLLVSVVARSLGLLVFLFGLYIVFQIAGLTGVALTVVGGTGLLGLILGIAFRDITENFLSSLFLSVQNPFYTGDLVEIDGTVGFVQLLTTRVTILMTLEGNHIQIPNTIVYKSKIINYTSNPNRRIDFTVGIGYEDEVTMAQELILNLLADHPAVLNDPEPLVLVDSLGDATVNLQIFFWVNGRNHSIAKVRSSVIRLVKKTFQEANISMPDPAREMLFPNGVSVHLIEPKDAQPPPASKIPKESDAISTKAEGDLRSEAGEIEKQVRHSRTPEPGKNLLDDTD